MNGFHVNRPRGDSPASLEARQSNAAKDRLRPGKRLDGAHMQRHAPTGTRQRELVAMVREITGRASIGWKAAKKYCRRVERARRVRGLVVQS